MISANPLMPYHLQLSARLQQNQNHSVEALKKHSQWQQEHIDRIEQEYAQLQQIAGTTHSNQNGSSSHYTPYPIIEEKALKIVEDNTKFMQDLILQQNAEIKQRNLKINKLQHSFSWQITGPLRAASKAVDNNKKVIDAVSSGVDSTIDYLTQLPIIKKRVPTSLKKLISKKK